MRLILKLLFEIERRLKQPPAPSRREKPVAEHRETPLARGWTIWEELLESTETIACKSLGQETYLKMEHQLNSKQKRYS